MLSYSHILAQEVSNISFEKLGFRDVELTKLCLLDYLGAAIGGSMMESAQIVKQWVVENGGKEEVPIICSPYKRPGHMAAFANGTMGHTIELDDVNMHCLGHPGVAIIPAVLSAAYICDTPGKGVLEGILSGYEAMGRLGCYLTEDHYRYWHATSTLGTFGATVATAKVREFSQDMMVNAIGIAGSFSSGLREVFVGGTSCKHIHPGRAAQNGMTSCELAKRGLTGPKTILDGSLGINKAMTTQLNPEGLLKTNNSMYEIHYTEFKPYASCRSAHSSVDCVLNILNKTRLDVSEVEQVNIATTTIICNDPSWGCLDPVNSLAGRLSIPYNAVIVLLDGECTMAQFEQHKIDDPGVRELLKKVKMIPDKEIDAIYPEVAAARIEIGLKDGTSFEEEVIYPKGHPKNPLTREELILKFKSLAMMQFSSDVVEKIVDYVLDLDKMDSVRPLMNLLTMPE